MQIPRRIRCEGRYNDERKAGVVRKRSTGSRVVQECVFLRD